MEQPDHIPPLKSGRFPTLLTPEREAQLRRLVAEKPESTLKELAQSMGNIVGPQSIKGWCKKLLLTFRKVAPTQGKLTPEIEQRLRTFVAEHPKTNLHEISQAIGNVATKGTLNIWINKLGLKYRQKKVSTSTILTPEIEARLRVLFTDQPSPSYREIVQAIGRRAGRRIIKKWCASLGLSYLPRSGPKDGLTSQIEARLRALVAENPSVRYHELAGALRVNTATAADWARRLNLPHQDPWQVLTPDFQSRLQALIAERPSASASELSKILGVHENTFKRWVKQLERSKQDRIKELAPELSERLRTLLAENPGLTHHEIVKTMHLPASTVARLMRENGFKPQRRSQRRPPQEIRDLLRVSLAQNSSVPYAKIADALKISRTSVRYMARKLGLPNKHSSKCDVVKKKERLQALLGENPLATYKELAATLGVNHQTVSRWARESGEPKRCVQKRVTPIIQEHLRALVADRPLASYKELADALKISMASVNHWIRRMNLPHRDGRGLRS